MLKPQFKVEIVEPTRIIFKDDESQAYFTIALHPDDKEAIESLKDFKVGQIVEITIEDAKPEPVEDSQESEGGEEEAKELIDISSEMSEEDADTLYGKGKWKRVKETPPK